MTVQGGGGSFNFNVFGDSSYGTVVGRNVAHHFAVPQAVASLPPSPAGFTGRSADLARLLAALDPTATTDLPVLVCSVSGLGGVGKTALALQAAHQARAKGWFTGGVLFVDLRGYDEPVAAEQAVVALLNALGVDGRELPPEPSSLFALYRSLLARRPEPVLLILDNASDPSQITPLLPGTGGHRVLVTSRDRLVELEARLVDLGPLGPDEAVAFLANALRLRHPDDPRPAREPDALRELALLCGGLPLALSIAVALLARRPQRSVASLVQELSGPSGRFEATLPQVFDSSYQRLAPELARVFRLLALAPTPEIGTDAAAAMTGLPARETVRLLEGLAVASLVVSARGSRLGDERWRFHNLVRDYAASLTPLADEEGKVARSRALDFYAERSRAALDSLSDGTGRSHRGFDDREHALAWLDEERPNLVAAAGWADDEQLARPAVNMGMSLVPYLIENGYFDDALAVSHTARLVAQRNGATGDEAYAWRNLGFVLSSLGRMAETVEAFARACELFQVADDLLGEAASWDDLGIALHETGRMQEAIDAHTRARDLYAQKNDRFLEAGVWNNLGIALRDAGRLAEATDAFVRSGDVMQEYGNKAGEADVCNNLGITLHGTGRTQEAVEAFTKAIALRRDLGDSYGEANALRNLALALSTTDDGAARDHWAQAAEAYERANAATEAAHARSQAESTH